MIIITFRVDTNKVLRQTKQTDLYVGSTNQIIQIFVHPSLMENGLNGDFILHYKNNATAGTIPLFISPEQQETFYILEAITDQTFTSISGQQEVWLEVKTQITSFTTTSVKIQIKPMREEIKYKYTTIDANDLESKLLSIRNECKQYYQMAKKEADKAKKCVEIMIDIIKKEGGI